MYRILTVILNLLLEFNILTIEEFKLDIDPITPIYWINSKEIFVNESEQSYTYNIEERKIEELYKKDDSEVYGYHDGEIYICQTETKSRKTIEDYSTHLRRTNLDGDILLDLELKPTLEVLECREDIILKTVFPIEEKFYIFTDDLYELESYQTVYFSPNLKYFIEIDSFGNYKIKNFSINLREILTLE